MKCLRCGAELRTGAAFCTKCGYQIPQTQRNTGDSTYRYVPSRPAQNQPAKKNNGASRIKRFFTAVLKTFKNIVVAYFFLCFFVLIIVGISEFYDENFKKEKVPETVRNTTPAVTEYKPTIQTDYVFYSIQEMKDTLAPTCIDEHLDVIVHYKGDPNDITSYVHGHLFGGRSSGFAQLEPGVFRIESFPYSGSKMLKAYRTGDYSNLTEDELEALYVAESVVAAARKEANSDMELEQWLHDWICRNVSYYNVDFTIEFTDRRQLNAVGALLDGKANCQGYTDCFYLLGNMAGFTVDRQVMPNHIFNTIKLGGNWYIVDVTYNDRDFSQYGHDMITYRYFNVGRDHSDGRSWAYEETRNFISETSGPYFYYYQTDSKGYNKLYDSIDILAEHVLAAHHSGKKAVHAMLLGAELTHEELYAAMQRVAKQKRISYGASYTVYNYEAGNTIYLIVFE